jgi:hypothetical protein
MSETSFLLFLGSGAEAASEELTIILAWELRLSIIRKRCGYGHLRAKSRPCVRMNYACPVIQ